MVRTAPRKCKRIIYRHRHFHSQWFRKFDLTIFNFAERSLRNTSLFRKPLLRHTLNLPQQYHSFRIIYTHFCLLLKSFNLHIFFDNQPLKKINISFRSWIESRSPTIASIPIVTIQDRKRICRNAFLTVLSR